MLTLNEKEGFTEMLKALSLDDLQSLSETVTNRKVKAETNTEAIHIILRYSESASELLSRKKLKAKYIFDYLHNNNIDVSASADKKKLIQTVLKFWKSNDANTWVPIENQDEDDTSDVEMVVYAAPSDPHLAIEFTITQSVESQHQNSEVQALARCFAEWFYKLLNEANGDFSTPENSNKFGPHHFWPESTLSLKLVNQNTNVARTGCISVACCLCELVSKLNMKFEPNGLNGVNGDMDVHGLVKVDVAGIVYQNLNPIGMFQQMFGLIKDPNFDGNWKIKVTELLLQVKEFVGNGLQLPSNVQQASIQFPLHCSSS